MTGFGHETRTTSAAAMASTPAPPSSAVASRDRLRAGAATPAAGGPGRPRRLPGGLLPGGAGRPCRAWRSRAPTSPATAGTRSSASSGLLRQAYTEISPPLDPAMDTLAWSTSTAVTFGEPHPPDDKAHPQQQRARVRSTYRRAERTAMPRPQRPSTTLPGSPNQSGKNTTATTTPAAAMTTDLTRSTTGQRQRLCGAFRWRGPGARPAGGGVLLGHAQIMPHAACLRLPGARA